MQPSRRPDISNLLERVSLQVPLQLTSQGVAVVTKVPALAEIKEKELVKREERVREREKALDEREKRLLIRERALADREKAIQQLETM